MIPLENHGAAGPLLETDASMLGLSAQRDSILRLIDLVMHLTCFIPTVDIHRTGATAHFVVSVVMLQIHRVSTHRRLGLRLHVSLELVELLWVAARLLMISVG